METGQIIELVVDYGVRMVGALLGGGGGCCWGE